MLFLCETEGIYRMLFLSETEGIYRMLFPMRNSIESPVTFRTLLKALTGVTTTSVSTALIL